MFHKGTGPVPETLRQLRETLRKAGIESVVIGAMAMAAHRVQRATEDVDICLRPEDFDRFLSDLVGDKYEKVAQRKRRFIDKETGVTINIMLSGELAGRVSRNDRIRFPDPDEAIEINGEATIPLPRLIELKLVTWRLKDWADVVELIRRNDLDESFSEQLDPLMRMAYLECYDNKVEEDRYEREA